jgi:hypothetical protein
VEIMLSPLSLAGAEGKIATVRDVTQRKRVEQALSQSREELETRVAERTAELSTERTNTVVALEIRARQQAALAGLSQRALEGAVLATLLDEAVRLVPAILGCEFCKVMELLPTGKALLLRAGVGWKKVSADSCPGRDRPEVAGGIHLAIKRTGDRRGSARGEAFSQPAAPV